MRPFKTQPKSRYGVKRVGAYGSKREAQYADLLKAEKAAGAIADFLEQVPIKLPGCKYVVDFAVIANDGTVRFVEVKGKLTEVAQLKLRALQEARPEIFARLEVVR